MAETPELNADRPKSAIQVVELRRAFDESFAKAIDSSEDKGELILAIRAGTDSYAIRLSEIAGIHECPKLAPLPGVKSTCLGIVGLRGRLHAVFRLSALVGGISNAPIPPWVLITPGQDAPMLAVEAIEGCFTTNPDEFRAVGQGGENTGHVRSLFVREGMARGVLHVPSLVAMATSGSGVEGREKT